MTATDGGGLSAFHTFDVTVANTNDAPTLATALADQSATEDTPFGYTLPTSNFVDADAGDILSFTATRADGLALPGWLAFDAATRTFSGMPGAADAGTLQVRVTATDTANASAADVFQLTVTGDEDDHHDNRRKGNEGVGNGADRRPRDTTITKTMVPAPARAIRAGARRRTIETRLAVTRVSGSCFKPILRGSPITTSRRWPGSWSARSGARKCSIRWRSRGAGHKCTVISTRWARRTKRTRATARSSRSEVSSGRMRRA